MEFSSSEINTFTADDVVDYPKEEIDRIEWNQSMMTEEIKESIIKLLEDNRWPRNIPIL